MRQETRVSDQFIYMQILHHHQSLISISMNLMSCINNLFSLNVIYIFYIINRNINKKNLITSLRLGIPRSPQDQSNLSE